MTSNQTPGTSPKMPQKLTAKQRQYVWYAAILTAGVIALVALGVSAGTLLVLALVLTCPLMMFFMMRGMHGGDGGGDGRDDDHGHH